MINTRKANYNTDVIDFSLEHNPYQAKIFYKNKFLPKTIVFPIYHYKGEQQYIDLIEPLVERGFRVITVNFIQKGDRILSFDYYYSLLEEFYKDVFSKKMVTPRDKLIFMGVGVGANVISHMENKNYDISKFILISPVNSYKSDYSISSKISRFKTPTYVMYGQVDKENSVDSRYQLFQKGKNNPNVHFSSYPCTGFYCYYERMTSIELEKLYRKNNIDVLIGSDRNNQPLFLPNEPLLNELFFTHLFNILENKIKPKKILLITETFPVYCLGKGTTIEFLAKELIKLGYETYITGLWKNRDDFSTLPVNYIPVIGYARSKNKNDKRAIVLKEFNYVRSAKMLAMFGFDYLHLYSDYRMSEVGLELAKITSIKMPYTYHTLWRLYYSKKINEIIKDSSQKFIRKFMRSRVFKESPLIISQSNESYQIFKNKSRIDKKFKLIVTPMNKDNLVFTKTDAVNVEILRKENDLVGKKIIGYVNKVSPEYNTFELIKYFATLAETDTQIVLLLVGTGNATKQLQGWTEKLGISERVIFVKEVTNNERKLYFHLFDVFVTGSDFELQGSPYFEAAASGTPIVAKSNRVTEEFFVDGESAYIYHDYYTFAEKVELALYNQNKRIIHNAKALAKQYDQEKWAKQLAKIYKDLNS